MLAFQRLNPGHFIVTDDPFTLLGEFLCPMIQAIDVGTFLLKLFIFVSRQPIADQMRFQIALFLKAVRRDGPKSVPLSLVSSTHRRFPALSSD